ncbi:preprotein translocase subunit SecG [Patescibacteria group bacterium]|nr:preprotein translocase subunit SecG [Patescibacteria group bacterium]
MQNAITIAQVASAIILIILVLMQNRGGGLSGVFGGGDSSNVFRTKRGLEKNIFIATIIFAILFLGISLANILLHVQ